MDATRYMFVIGAPKAGTSSIAAAFEKAAEVDVARIKEPCFFTDFAKRAWQGPKAHALCEQVVGDWATYESLFGDAAWRLDASTDYLSCPVTPERLAAFAERQPVKVAAILRDPVERIISEFQHTLRDGYQSGSLAASLAAEDSRTADGWHPLFRHVARSRYAGPIQRYRKLFGDDFRVLDFHGAGALGRNVTVLAEMMGVEAPSTSVLPHENRSYAPKSRTLSNLMNAEGVVQTARRIIPAGLRGAIRGTAARMNAGQYAVTQEELRQMRQALADDIAWCVADPGIPTDHWQLAKGEMAHCIGGQLPSPRQIMADAQP